MKLQRQGWALDQSRLAFPQAALAQAQRALPQAALA
jgi:hypothetical protein